VAENNKQAVAFYRARHFQKLDAAVFMARRVDVDDELLPPRALKKKPAAKPPAPAAAPKKAAKKSAARKPSAKE
jgi:hypothetical protein